VSGGTVLAYGDDVAVGNELVRFRDRKLERVHVARVGIRDGSDPALNFKQAEDRKVFVRLRPRALVRVDDEQE
jgi:hypothetical protein